MASIINNFLGLAKYVPASTVVGLMKKSIPKLGKFFSESLATGLTAHQIVEFMNDRISDNSFREQLDHLHGKGLLTSEEESLRKKEHGKSIPGKIARAGLAYGTAGLLGGQQEAQESSPEQSRESEIDETVTHQAIPQNQQMQSEQQRQYDPLAGLSKFPELMQFIQREVQKGKDPMVVAATAKKSPKLSPMVQMIEREIEEPFESLLGRLFSTFKGSQQQAPQQAAPQNDKMSALLEALQQLKAMRGRK